MAANDLIVINSIVKTLEKQKENYEEKLKNLLAQDKKDSGLVFDELGIDHIFIDESNYGKNLATPSKMDRVARHSDRWQ